MATKLYTTIIQSKKAHIALMSFGTVFVLIVVFQTGVQIGYRQASFAYGLGDNYYNVFGGQERRGEHTPPRTGVLAGMPMPFGQRLPASHGAIGTIVSLSLPTFVIANQDGTEQIIHVQDNTLIRKNRSTLRHDELREGDSVVVVGKPNASAEIDARFIRIMPPRQ